VRLLMTQSSGLSDEELAEQARAGSEAHFNALVDRYTAVVYRIARGITGSPEEAEEVVQETFLKAFRNLDQFAPTKGTFKTWLLTIARNQSINVFRSLKRRAARFFTASGPADQESFSGEDLPDPEGADAEELLSIKQELVRVELALSQLPERQRTALQLRTQQGLSYAEIAVVLDTSASAVESLIFRARQKILEKVER
jgi:RNA polymerase sigma factor (sigma-70 family)